MASKKRCHYEILGLTSDCSPEEIRSAYRKLALQRHPDKLIQTGVPEKQATAAFQELVNAYEVLSDPGERAWYDSHRSQILSSDSKSSKTSSDPVPNLFSFFSNSVFSGFGDTGKGFYKVYGDVFGRIHAQEVTFARKFGLGEESVRIAPLMGNLRSPYDGVTAFYKYWLRFSTVMDFCWADEYDAMAEPDRKSRRLMEEENMKLRKRARKEYIETVRGLAKYAKKRDKRIVDIKMKRELEQEKKREEEKARKEEAARAKLERAEMYEEEDYDDDRENEVNVLYCVACRKKFKSDKQWKNHEKSKKHREKVAELGDTFHTEDKEDEECEGGEEDGNTNFGPSTSVDNVAHEQFENDIGLREEKSGRKSRKKSTNSQLGESEEIDLKEYNIRRNIPRNQEARREGARKCKEEAVSMGMGGDTKEVIPDHTGKDARGVEDSSNAHVPEEVDLDNRRNPVLNKNQKVTNQQIKKKDTVKGDANTKMRNTYRGKEQTARTSLWMVSDATHNTCATSVDHSQATSILWWVLLYLFYILSGFYVD